MSLYFSGGELEGWGGANEQKVGGDSPERMVVSFEVGLNSFEQQT